MPMMLAAIPGIIAGATLAEIATVASIALTIGTTEFGAVQQGAAAKKAKAKQLKPEKIFSTPCKIALLPESLLTRPCGMYMAGPG